MAEDRKVSMPIAGNVGKSSSNAEIVHSDNEETRKIMQKAEKDVKFRALNVIYGIITQYTVDNICDLALAEYNNIIMWRKIHELNDMLDDKMEEMKAMKNKNLILLSVLKNIADDLNESVKICESEIKKHDEKRGDRLERKKYESIHFHPEFVDSVYEMSPYESSDDNSEVFEKENEKQDDEDADDLQDHKIRHCDSFTLLKYQGDFPKVSFYKVFQKPDRELLKTFEEFENAVPKHVAASSVTI